MLERLVAVLLFCVSMAIGQQPGSYTTTLYAGGGSDTSANVAALKASLPVPPSLAYDSTGNLLLVESGMFGPRVRRLGTDGQLRVLTTAPFLPLPASLIGLGVPAWSIAARADGTPLLAADSRKLAGSAFVYEVVQVDTSGTMTVVAGTGKSGFSGDNGPALSAQFSDITALAVDGTGNIYVADDGNARIRKISTSGTVTTIAGIGVKGSQGDGGLATSAQISLVGGLAVINGAVYFTQPLLHTIRRIRSDGVMETFAGNGVAGVPKDGSDAHSVSLNAPSALASTSDGRVLFLDAPQAGASLTLETVDSAGRIWAAYSSQWTRDTASPASVCFATTGQIDIGFTNSPLSSVTSVASDRSGNLAVAISGSATVVYRLTPISIMVSAAGMVSAASYNDILSPGLIFAVYGSGFGPSQIVTASFDTNGQLPTSLAGNQLLVDGVPVPLLYVRNDVISGIVPFAAGGSSSCGLISVKQGSLTTYPVAKQIFRTTPSIFTLDSSGVGQAAAINEDGTVNGPSNPIARGHVIVLYATGSGILTPTPPDGSRIPVANLPKPVASTGVTIGGQSAQVNYAGAAPTLVAGVIQINAVVPSSIPTGIATVTFVVDGNPSDQFLPVQGRVTIAVK